MKGLTHVILFLLLATLALGCNPAASEDQPVSDAAAGAAQMKALIIDGQNNHEMWPKTTMMMKQYLEETGLFTVDVERTVYTWNGDEYLDEYKLEDKAYEALEQPREDPNYQPDFSAYDVVISNFGWRAATWPASTQKALEDFVSQGGGLVIVHAADNSWPEWQAFNQMIGLGGWGRRTEKDGPYVYYTKEGELVRDTTAGPGGNHGPQHEYQITLREKNHPITQGMPEVWLHTQDELYEKLRGPAENMTVLATAYASPEHKGSDRHEPMLMTIEYGKGRVFHTPMGHADYSMACVGFIASLQRGTEWAATGKVTQRIPADFPTAEATSKRDFVWKK